QIMPVATFAQAAGALVGAALGMCVISHNARRGAWATALVLVALATGVGPALGRPVLDVANRFRNYPHEGEIALENGKYDTAIELLNTAVQEDPKNTQALLDLATAELKYGNEDEAIDAFKRVVTLDASKRSELAPKIAELLGGKAFQAISARKAADARAAAEEALKWDPNNGQALHVTGLLLNAAGKFDEAIATLRKAKEHTSETEYSDASFTFDMGLLAARTGHLPEAEQRFRESLKANDSPLTWFYLAQCLEQNRSSAEAINAYEEAAKFFELTKPAKDAEIKLLLGAGN
ncbi:MAG TPA: tetratricopeptide repeat protein, partial [Polyangiaceae bacterium]|nr:tetratricopeptide repeat protein [Polyangiaceae bacterium]